MSDESDEKNLSAIPLFTDRSSLKEILESQYSVIFDEETWETRDPDYIISKRIKDMMDIYDLTQTQLANKLGITASYISSLLNGRKNLTQEFIKSISNKIGVSWRWLLKGVGPIVMNNSFTIVQHLSNINVEIQPEDSQFLTFLFSHSYEVRKIFYSFFKMA